MKYTEQQIADMNYAQLRSIKTIKDLPDKMADRLRNEIMQDAGKVVNTGVEVSLVSEDGRREFYAKRHSDRRTGSSIWSVRYCMRGYGVVKECIGYGFGIVRTYFGRTIDGTQIPQNVGYKKDVLAIIEHIEWAKNMLDK